MSSNETVVAVFALIMCLLIISLRGNNNHEVQGPTIKAVPNKPATGPTTNWSEWQTFEATAYSSDDPGCNRLTKTEYYLVPGSRVVAVDPSLIPLHSIVEIEGMGEFYALDIGGAIKGKRIDIWYWHRKNALEFGRRNVKLRWRPDLKKDPK